MFAVKKGNIYMSFLIREEKTQRKQIQLKLVVKKYDVS